MSMKSITIRMDDGLKKAADALFAELGMNFSTAVTIFVRQAIREQRIPFKVSADPFYSANMKEKIVEGLKTPLDQCVPEDEVQYEF